MSSLISYYYSLLKNRGVLAGYLTNLSAGQTIIEVLIATAVVALVMTTVVAGLGLSVRNSAQSRYKVVAGRLAQEGLESLRLQRDQHGWESFYDVMQDKGTGRYCLNSLPTSLAELDSMEGGACDSTIAILGTEFTREINLIVGTSPAEVEVEIEVSWLDGEVTRISQIEQIFRQLD